MTAEWLLAWSAWWSGSSHGRHGGVAPREALGEEPQGRAAAAGPRMKARGVKSSAVARRAWDATLKREVGMVRAPGEAEAKRHTTRRILREARAGSGPRVDELEQRKRARLERLELTNAWDEPLAEETKGRMALAKLMLESAEEQRAMGSFVMAAARPSRYPGRMFVCAATGRAAKYKDPTSHLRFADRRALGLLKESLPPWVRQTPLTPYWDAVDEIQQ